MSRFYFPSSQTSSASTSPRSSTDTALPFPEPLPRSDFLTPSFSPSTYLSTVAPSRHQTLEDLRTELRSRSQQLSRELLDLVNAHYADFLGLGGSLNGGKEKVEELKVGLLGFQREAEGIRDAVEAREREVEVLMGERRRVRKELEVGRRLLEWEGRVGLLEGRLQVVDSRPRLRNGGVGKEDYSEDEEEEIDSEAEELPEAAQRAGNGTASPHFAQLNTRIQDYKLIQRSASLIGMSHPFIVAEQPRVMKIRNTLLLDLGNSLRQASGSPAHTMSILAMYRDLDAGRDAVEILRTSRK